MKYKELQKENHKARRVGTNSFVHGYGLIHDKVNLNIIADEIMRIHEKNRTERSVLKLLKEDKAKAEKSLNNILIAIEEGIINTTSKTEWQSLNSE